MVQELPNFDLTMYCTIAGDIVKCDNCPHGRRRLIKRSDQNLAICHIGQQKDHHQDLLEGWSVCNKTNTNTKRHIQIIGMCISYQNIDNTIEKA